MLRHTIVAAIGAASFFAALGTAQAAPTAFEADVETAIDRGLAYFDGIGAFNQPSSVGDAAGLTTLALLEKRPPGAPDQPPLGYAGASPADQARIRTSIRHILNNVASTPFDHSYRDGASLMALAVYLRTGGPDRGADPDLPVTLPFSVDGAIDFLFDRFKAYQNPSGYWPYGSTDSDRDDSSTTQFVMAGLAAARAVFNDAGKPWADAVRVAQLNDMTKKARDAYVSGGLLDKGDSCGGSLDARERAHGYNRGSDSTLQQTASGTWIQLVGGVTVNDPSVQGYLRWIENRYRYSNLGNAGDGWSSYWYYMWSSAKAYFFIKESKVKVAAGNLNPLPSALNPASTLGKTQPTDAPVCNDRQLSRNPGSDPRVPGFGNEPAGYYAGQPSDFYYDYAYTLMGYQCSAENAQKGSFNCNGAPSTWGGSDGTASRDAYALLVLMRSVGGGCIDIDKDGVCDADEAAPPQGGGGTCDINNDSRLDKIDISFIYSVASVKPAGSLATGNLAAADMNKDGRIDIRDYNTCLTTCLKSGASCR